ncbi:MAG TPA: PAS domain S-box protein [Pyrinomonadaceae bacterium]|nr:PAS domain S-box protein [Pyrinomonadaceae bacterium]
MVLDLAGLLAREQAVRRETEILRDANIALTENLSLDRILETLLDYLTKLVPYDSANVMLRQGESMFVVSALRRYEVFQDIETTRAIAFNGDTNPLLRRICLTKQSLVVPDTDAEPEWQTVTGADHVRNWMGVPLVASGKVIGLYSVDKIEPEFFKPEHARLAETLAARAASAIQNAQLFAQSQHYVAELEERITERRRAEVALRESEERYRELFENARDAIYVHDRKGNYTSVNRAAEKLTGYARHEILGRNFTEFIAKEHIPYLRDCLFSNLAQNGETTYELEVIAKDGRRVPVEVSSRAIYENGAIVGVQGTARDITERKRTQDTLRMFSRQLIEAQEDERRRISRDLHDQIGQALTAVKLNLHTVQQVCPDPEASHCIKDNVDAVDEALRLVRDLSVDLRPPLLDDLGLATALCWFVDRYAKRYGVTIEVIIELPNHNERFSRELETACFRIAQEALTNVVRHARATNVVLQLTRTDELLEMVVRDDGIGFDPDALRKRAPRAATLGLVGMQERAHAAGGQVQICSKPSRGTEISFTIPLETGDSPFGSSPVQAG